MFDRCVYHWLIIGDHISEGQLYLLGENAILIFLRELYQPENIYNRIQSRSIQKPLNPIDKKSEADFVICIGRRSLSICWNVSNHGQYFILIAESYRSEISVGYSGSVSCTIFSFRWTKQKKSANWPRFFCDWKLSVDGHDRVECWLVDFPPKIVCAGVPP